MPEGPELNIAARFVNKICADRLFKGPVCKSEVSTKNPDIPWAEESYRISASSRGKEVKLFLTANGETEGKKAKKKKAEVCMLSILVRFGMSGKFQFTHKSEMDKHAHLNFYTRDGGMVLSFVDYRRFGRWEVTDDWGPNRGPCIITEPQAFRENVLTSLDKAVFNRPICEAMLDQKFFNGIGNYLRAEILYRLSIPPFEQARKVLEKLADGEEKKCEVKDEVKEESDILHLCHSVAMEVVELSTKNNGKSMYESSKEGEGTGEFDDSPFFKWLRCYYKPGMHNMVDHNSRTIWFHGPAGPLAPKVQKSREKVKRKKLIEKSAAEEKGTLGATQAKKLKMTREAVKTEAGRTSSSGDKDRKRSSRGKSGQVKEVKQNGTSHSTKVKSTRRATTKEVAKEDEELKVPNGDGRRRSGRIRKA